jgi:mono/diheme cytochrome c family protein
MKRVVAFVAVLMGGVALAAQGTPQQVEAGRKLYNAKKCAQCHTIEGKGGTVTKLYPLDGVGAKLSAADMKRWLTHPEEMEAKLDKPPKLKMSSKKVPLTPEEADALTAYMLVLTKPLK